MAESNKLPTSKKLNSHFNNPARNKVHRIFLPQNKKKKKTKQTKLKETLKVQVLKKTLRAACHRQETSAHVNRKGQ